MDEGALLDSIRRSATEEFSRSGGPGGQNVNKTSTKVVLRVPVGELALSEEEKERVLRRLSNRLNREGELVIHSSETRSQTTNRYRAEARAYALLRDAATPQKKRRKTRPSKAARERRIEEKKRRGEKKRMRRDPEP
ncbi:MAG: alternative ribosome rescue aminoacyl-tRNA hydrolase ArfB [Spirochaetaceae bacterium]